LCDVAAGTTHAAAGRGDLVDQAERALARRGCALVGPPGIGKTHTAHLLAERAAATMEAVWIVGSAATADVPFGAMAALLPAPPGDLDLPAIVLARTALADRAGERPLLLVVDDAHWLDEASAALVRQLALGGEATLLVTQRSEVPAPDPVLRLWRDQTIERIDLGGLDIAAIAAITAELLGAPVEPASAVAMWDRSCGNPLFARELALAARTAGEWVLGPDGLRWQAGAAAAPRLAELLGDRLAALPDEHRQALAHLAFGEPLGFDEMVRVTNEAVLDDLEREGLITADVDGQRLNIRFAHPLHAEVVRRSTTPLRARMIRATLANVLAAVAAAGTQTARREDDVRLASLALDAGVDIDSGVLRRAAAVALLGDDGELAVRLADEAHRRAPTFASGRTLADALVRFGELDDARDHWNAWATLATTDTERREVAVHRASGELRRGGDTEAAIAVLAEARDEHADLLVLHGHYAEALALAEPGSLAQAVALTGLGRAAESLALTPTGAAGARDDDLGWATNRTAALLALGRFDEAIQCAEAAIRVARRAGDRTAEALAERMRADLLGIVGRHGEAQAAIGAAEAATTRLDQAAHLARSLGVRAWLASCRGDRTSALAALRRLDQLPVPASTPGSWAMVAREWAAGGDGRDLERQAAELAGTGAVFGALRAFHAAAALAARSPSDAATELAATVDGPFAAALAANDRTALRELGAVAIAAWPGDSPAHDAAPATPLTPLTRREREVALLASQGLPARTIGERLFLSSRTVENHLNRAYDKLGIRSRSELAQLLAVSR
jgi:DNA-binding CsgD family transcriptional regulator